MGITPGDHDSFGGFKGVTSIMLPRPLESAEYSFAGPKGITLRSTIILSSRPHESAEFVGLWASLNSSSKVSLLVFERIASVLTSSYWSKLLMIPKGSRYSLSSRTS